MKSENVPARGRGKELNVKPGGIPRRLSTEDENAAEKMHRARLRAYGEAPTKNGAARK